MSENKTERENRMFWVYDSESNTVIETRGYSCAPNNPHMWWFPQVGFSGHEGHWCFQTKSEAIAAGVKKCEEALETAQKRLEQMKQLQSEYKND